MHDDIQKAVEILGQGGIVIFPTDTAFGIGCRVDDEEAVKKLFALRRRPVTQATPVLFSSVEMVEEYVRGIPENIMKLMDKYWPGALTIILPAQIDRIPDPVRGGGQTIGTRIPNNQTIIQIIKGFGLPILGPSANFHGELTPYAVEDLNPELVKLVDYVVPGICSLKQASTVLDTTVDPWKIVRQGAIRLEL